MTNSLVSEVLMSCNNDYCFFAELTELSKEKKLGFFCVANLKRHCKQS